MRRRTLPPEPGLTVDPSGLPPRGGVLTRPRGPAVATEGSPSRRVGGLHAQARSQRSCKALLKTVPPKHHNMFNISQCLLKLRHVSEPCFFQSNWWRHKTTPRHVTALAATCLNWGGVSLHQIAAVVAAALGNLGLA